MNLLFVSIAFPPKRDPESLQVLKYYTELTKFEDVNVSVVTSTNPTLFMAVDEKLLRFCSGFEELIELKISENKYLNFLKRKLDKESLNYPDSKFTFYKQSKKIVNKLKSTPDIIYSRSFPLSSAFLAYELSIYYNKPWILHLSDPWSFKSKNDQHLSKSEKWNLEKEELFFSKAQKICFTSIKTIDFYKTKYPQFEDKFEFYPNVYNKKEARITTAIKREKGLPLKFIYTGGLTRERNPSLFLECLSQLQREKVNLHELIQFEFIGPKDSYIKSLELKYPLSFVKYRAPVSYEESKAIQEEADVLIMIDSPLSGNHLPVYFPSKILDYMITRKPILAVTPCGSTTNEVITKYSLGKCFDYNELQKMKQYLLDCIDGRVDLTMSLAELPEDFDANFNANRLYNLFLHTYEEKN